MKAAAITLFVFIIVFLVYFKSLPFWQWFYWTAADSEKLHQLTLANESLKAQLTELQLKLREQLTEKEYFLAKIYSSYPFNNKHSFTIAAGKSDDIKENMIVLAEKNIFLGTIDKVFENYSEVKSIFSPDLQLPVKIGEKGVDGLFIGGPDPKITMIIGEEKISPEDVVYTANKELVYGLIIGKIKKSKIGASNFFQEASLIMPYDFNRLLEVLILTAR